MRLAFLAVSLVLAAPWLAGPAGAAGPALLSHRAIYEMTLAHAGHGSDLVDLSGRMVLEWIAACDGYTTNQRLVTRSSDNQGQETLNDFLASSWEAKDGRAMRFAARQQLNGKPVQEFVGHAVMGPGKANGRAIYTKPQPQTVGLPGGTAFPTEEINNILAAARAGKLAETDVVFDGSGETALYRADAYIVAVPAKQGFEAAGGKSLRGVRSWKVEVSYFPFDSKEGVPEYELSFRLYENGVSTDLLLDYGKLAIKGRLTSLKPLSKQGC